MSRSHFVSRADLLRLLAEQPAAPLTKAARLAGYQPEQQTLLPQEEKVVYETAPAAAAETEQKSAAPVFWRLTRREPQPVRPSLKPVSAEWLLPKKLRPVQPLRAQDLHFTDLDSLPPEPAPAASPRLSSLSLQKALVQAAGDAARLRRPSARQNLSAFKNSGCQRLDRLPPPLGALALLRQGEPLERSQIDWLQHFFLRLARTWFNRPKDSELLAYIRQLLALLPDSLRRSQDGPAFLYGILHREELRAGALIPQQYQAEAVASIVQQPLSDATWLLTQEGEELFLINCPDSGLCLLQGSRIGVLLLDADIILLHQGEQTATAPVQSARSICSLQTCDTLCLQTQREAVFIQPCAKPEWATQIGRNSRDLFTEILWLGRSCRLYWQIPLTSGQGRWQSYGSPVNMDSLSLKACISFQGRVMQHFRWLEPGRFFMGSPADEPEREIWGKETLHEVRLSKGFWMAETAVTQELWRFVMQNNPSAFRGGKHPVDSVTWDEAQLFLQRLNALLPGLNARLPWEAEWEYACRAGTETAFSFGSRITPEQVNYNGHFSCHSGIKGLFRRCTAPVRSLPANAWGLHEMHGNLWEWCQDCWLDDLGSEPVCDPQGPATSEFRAVRGGSWFLGGKGVRSAVRGKFAPALRSNRIGFRIVCDQDLMLG